MTPHETAAPERVAGVVVGDDGSQRALEAIEFAAEEAGRRGVQLNVVRTWNIKTAVRPDGIDATVVPSTQEFHDATLAVTRRRAEAIAAKHGIAVDPIVVHGPAAKTLIYLSGSADVVVVGARGVGGLAGRFIGSVADSVVREAECPVIVVHHRHGG